MKMNKRYLGYQTKFKTREENGEMMIDGYFAVFDDVYDIGYGMSESIDKSAFDDVLEDDVRALVNHDTTLVLGRTKAGTLKLSVDDKGLYGHISINPNDRAAVDLYERVKRGDVDQCSFGFDILQQDTTISDNGDVHWKIEKVKLYEVSCCTFPAYEGTSIEARSKERESILEQKLEAWREKQKERLNKWH